MDDMLGGGRFVLMVPVGDAAAQAQAMTDIAALPFDENAARDQSRRFTVEIASHRYRALMEDLARA
jgi:hypothetical protein